MSATPDDQEFQQNKSEIEEDKGFRVQLQKSLSTPLNQIAAPPTCPKTIKQSKTKETSTTLNQIATMPTCPKTIKQSKTEATSSTKNKRGGRGINHVPIVEHFSAPVGGVHGMSSGVHTTRARQGGKFLIKPSVNIYSRGYINSDFLLNFSSVWGI